MKKNDNRAGNNDTLARRTVLKTAGSAGAVAGFGIGTVSADISVDSVEIPELVSDGEVVSYRTVPRQWYEHMRHVERVNRTVQRRYSDEEGVFSIGIAKAPGTYGGKKGLQIKVALTNDFKGEIPDTVDGVPITTQAAPETWGRGCYNFETNDYIQGGEVIQGKNRGTTGCRIEFNGNLYMITAAHLFWDSCDDATNNSLIGRVAEQRNEDETTTRDVGTVEGYDVQEDWAYFDTSLTSATFENYIDENSSYPDVNGYVHRDTLKAMEDDSSDTVYQMGTTTGKTKGHITQQTTNSRFLIVLIWVVMGF